MQAHHDASGDLLHARDSSASIETAAGNPYLPVSITRPGWSGLDGVTEIIVFGDSYSSPYQIAQGYGSESSDSEYDDSTGGAAIDSSNTVVTDSSEPPGPHKWIEFLVTERRDVKVINFARNGHTALEDFDLQLNKYLNEVQVLEERRSKPPQQILYVIWFGINDCAEAHMDDLKDIVTSIFDGLHRLYVRAAARNFLIIDVPPMDKCPLARIYDNDRSEVYKTWNHLIVSSALEFASQYTQATVYLYSSYHCISTVLEHEEDYGFSSGASEEMEGEIWVDGLHLRPDMHRILEKSLLDCLTNVNA